MRVQEIMTTDVLTIGPEAPLKDVARILVEHRVSGIPVCDIERRVLGVVSEGDILYKSQARDGRGGALAWLLDSGSASAAAKAAARTVDEAMTAPAITISPLRSVDEAARLMTEHGVNRLPVVAGGELVGIVTRADLVRAFTRSDAAIRDEIVEELLERTLWLEPGAVHVGVVGGHVRLAGRLQTRSDASLLERLVSRVAGVVSVEPELGWVVDDSTRKGRKALAYMVR
ncbi:MAG TPA: CBS domain-containing protein [Gaiellaceae bacterium]|nr:CBS domain-containing protein [Gaiellaceae bacterium]